MTESKRERARRNPKFFSGWNFSDKNFNHVPDTQVSQQLVDLCRGFFTAQIKQRFDVCALYLVIIT